MYSKEQILNLNRATQEFYSKKSQEFSDTRQNPWDGWLKFKPLIVESFSDYDEVCVTDIGCGNLRFETFLSSALPNNKIKCLAVDSCKTLVDLGNSSNSEIMFSQVDIIECLLDDCLSNYLIDSDLSVAFGLLHHIPSYELRMRLLCNMAKKIQNGGLMIMSLWDFTKDPSILKKAISAKSKAVDLFGINYLEDKDYFLNWAGDSSVFRFCHSFDDGEISQISNDLVKKFDLNLVGNFDADGKTNNLNKYLVFQKN